MRCISYVITTLFFFKFINDNYGKDEMFWSKSFDNPKRRAWCGLTFITTFGVKKNKYSGSINNQIILDDLFEAVRQI